MKGDGLLNYQDAQFLIDVIGALDYKNERWITESLRGIAAIYDYDESYYMSFADLAKWYTD